MGKQSKRAKFARRAKYFRRTRSFVRFVRRQHELEMAAWDSLICGIGWLRLEMEPDAGAGCRILSGIK